MFMLQTSETALAKFPDLPQAKSVVNSATSWMSVSFADEPPSEIQLTQTYCSTGEIHSYQQAWLQLVRTQINQSINLPFSSLLSSSLRVGFAVALQFNKFPVPVIRVHLHTPAHHHI